MLVDVLVSVLAFDKAVDVERKFVYDFANKVVRTEHYYLVVHVSVASLQIESVHGCSHSISAAVLAGIQHHLRFCLVYWLPFSVLVMRYHQCHSDSYDEKIPVSDKSHDPYHHVE